MRKHIHFLIAAIVLVAGQAVAEPEKKYTVYVSIDADEELSVIESYIKRELRDLKDVEIVDADNVADVSLRVVAVPIMLGGQLKGCALAVLYSGTKDPSLNNGLKRLLWMDQEVSKIGAIEPFLSDKAKEVIEIIMEGALSLERAWPRPPRMYEKLMAVTVSVDGLKRQCVELVADFDTRILERRRKSDRVLGELGYDGEPWALEESTEKDEDK